MQRYKPVKERERERLYEFTAFLQSDLWETNADYKITLPIQIGKLMVAFVDSLFGPGDNSGSLNYYTLK